MNVITFVICYLLFVICTNSWNMLTNNLCSPQIIEYE